MLLNPSARSLVKASSAARRSYIEIGKLIHLRRLTGSSVRNYQNLSGRHHQCCHFSSASRLRIEEVVDTPEFIQNYKRSLEFPAATHEIEKLSQSQLDEEVVLHGYLGSRSDVSRKLSFAPLLSKDLQYSIQIISIAKSAEGVQPESHSCLKSLNQHVPVAVRGKIKTRKPSKTDWLGEIKKIDDVEIELMELYQLNSFPRDVMMTSDTNFPSEKRHLQLRATKSLREALAFRAEVASICRNDLRENGFIEIETPLLFKSTPEGAREFLVPTREKGMAYALPQSPQQYKQILMASGISKYFQVARCFRDEDLRADRQPEFTQVDIEMSFATGEQVIGNVERLLQRLWKEMLSVDVPGPFRRMAYNDTMAKYGSDKPDLRLGMELHDIGELLPADLISKIGPHINPAVDIMKLHVSDDASETRKFVSVFMDSPDAAPFMENPDGQPGIFIYDPRAPLEGLQPFGWQTAEYVEDILDPQEGDLLVLQARKKGPFSGGFTPAGRLRLALHKAAVAQGYIPAPTGFEFLWVNDFPLFSPSSDTEPGQGGSAGFSSTHHPFTSPKTAQDVDLLATNPENVCAEHYDIVVNGVELGGGSRRIHDARVQEYVLRDVLKMSEERLQDFRHLLDVLRVGCPPHAGIALGFDRLVAVMLGRNSIKDVIAFPKNAKGEDLLVKSPNMMTPQQLATYHLRLAE
ncbi:aspartyl-trna synthetase [Venturia nashicola]|nr:aspartyl-trna synthetase [Venturia nashicola]